MSSMCVNPEGKLRSTSTHFSDEELARLESDLIKKNKPVDLSWRTLSIHKKNKKLEEHNNKSNVKIDW